DGKEVWVTVRGESYVSVLDSATYQEKTRIETPNGPGMQIFSPDGKYGYVCSSFSPETVVVSVADHRVVGHVPQASPFCPYSAAGGGAGRLHDESRGKGAGVRRAPAVRRARDARDRTHHEPRQLRAQRARELRLRDGGGSERGPGVPNRGLPEGRGDSRRQAA